MFFGANIRIKKGASQRSSLPFSQSTVKYYFNSEKVANGQAVCLASFLSKTRTSYFNSEKYLIVRTI